MAPIPVRPISRWTTAFWVRHRSSLNHRRCIRRWDRGPSPRSQYQRFDGPTPSFSFPDCRGDLGLWRWALFDHVPNCIHTLPDVHVRFLLSSISEDRQHFGVRLEFLHEIGYHFSPKPRGDDIRKPEVHQYHISSMVFRSQHWPIRW